MKTRAKIPSTAGCTTSATAKAAYLNHIRNFGEWHRTHEEFPGEEKKNPDETNEILEFVKMLEKAA